MKRGHKGKLILLSALIGGIAFAAGPQITLSVTDEPLSVVLESISKQASVAIVMTNEVAGQEPVSLKVRNAELENALEQALRNYNYTLSFSAEQNVISKVVVTVQEKKDGCLSSGKNRGDSDAFLSDASDVSTVAQKGISQIEAGIVAIKKDKNRSVPSVQPAKNASTELSLVFDQESIKGSMERLVEDTRKESLK